MLLLEIVNDPAFEPFVNLNECPKVGLGTNSGGPRRAPPPPFRLTLPNFLPPRRDPRDLRTLLLRCMAQLHNRFVSETQVVLTRTQINSMSESYD